MFTLTHNNVETLDVRKYHLYGQIKEIPAFIEHMLLVYKARFATSFVNRRD